MNILIIGANSAVAKELAARYAREGNRLFLLARNKEKLKARVDALGDAVAGYESFDFNDTECIEVALKNVKNALGSIDLVLIAHGYLGDQIESEISYTHAYDVIHSNYINVIAFLIPLMGYMKQQDKGKIAVLLSVAGERGRPRNFTYGSAKGALSIYLQGLRSTLYDSNIEVYSLKLGPIDSPMTIDHEKNFSFSTVETVADLIQSALSGKRYTVYIPGYWFWVMWVVRWLPESIFQRLKFLSER